MEDAKMAYIGPDSLSESYGVDLPAFAFDYSEFFVSATITRQRYVTIVLLGHHIISEDEPIEAISTDYDNLEHWKHATQAWNRSSLKYGTSRSKMAQMYCVMHAHNDPHTKAQQTPATWMRVSTRSLSESGLASNFNRHIEMLRCPLPSSVKHRHSSFLTPDAASLGSSDTDYTGLGKFNLDIDIFRRESPLGGVRSSNHSGNTHLMSFSLPWKTGYAGYPFINPHAHPNKKTKEDPQPLALEKNTEIVSSNSDVSISACVPGVRLFVSSTSSKTTFQRSDTGVLMLLEFISHLIRVHEVDQVILGVVLHPHSPYFRALSTLIHSIYTPNQVSLVSTSVPGYDDVAGLPGLQLSDDFADTLLINHCLQSLKRRASSLETHRQQQPPSQYILVLRANQFLVSFPVNVTQSNSKSAEIPAGHSLKHLLSTSTATGSTSPTVSTGFQTLVTPVPLASFVQQSSLHSNVASVSAPSSQGHRHLLSAVGMDRLCALHFVSGPMYQLVTDPETVFNDHGPGDFTFLADFFVTSKPLAHVTPTVDDTKQKTKKVYGDDQQSVAEKSTRGAWSVSLFNVDRVLALDVIPSISSSSFSRESNGKHRAVVHPVCTGFPASQTITKTSQKHKMKGNKESHGTSSMISNHSSSYAPVWQGYLSRAEPSSRDRTVLTKPQMVIQTFLSPQQAALETTSSVTDSASNPASDSSSSQHFFQQVHHALQRDLLNAHGSNSSSNISISGRMKAVLANVADNVGSRKSRTIVAKELRSIFQELLTEASGTSPVERKTRRDVVLPFWRRCDTAHLSAVLQRYFNGGSQ